MNERTDPIVEEVRRFRAEHAQQFDGDLAAICADLRKIQQECQHQIVTFPPKTIRIQPHGKSHYPINERIAA